MPATLDLVHRCETAIDRDDALDAAIDTETTRITARNRAAAVRPLIDALAMMALANAALTVKRLGIEAGKGDHDKALATIASRGFDRHADTA